MTDDLEAMRTSVLLMAAGGMKTRDIATALGIRPEQIQDLLRQSSQPPRDRDDDDLPPDAA